jgi:hypothetical protein
MRKVDGMKLKLIAVPALIILSALNATAATPQRRRARYSEKDLKTAVITLKRTPCFGACPIYSVTIYGNGTVVYEGERFVKVTGKRTHRISKASVRELVDEFFRIGYFSLRDEYVSVKNPDGTVTQVTDLPSRDTSITIGTRAKSVHNYYGGPESLARLERKIDKISGVAKYVGKN